jgi:hypothetical protein
VAFQVLGRLGNSGGLIIHIPYLVRKEFLGHREEEYVEPLQEIEKIYSKVVKKPLPTELQEDLTKQSSALIASIPEVRNWVEREFKVWCDHVGAKIHEIRPHHGEKVVDAYFNGELPFKKKKNRADFPDAFILESIKDLASNVDLLNVVVADKHLRDACVKIDNVTTFERLDGFVRSDACHAVFQDAEVADNFETIMDELKRKAGEVGEEASKKIFDELVGYTFSDSSIPDDNNEATISMLDVPIDAGLKWDEAEYYGSGVISIPFEFEMTATADYYIFKSDYYCMDEKRAESIGISEYDNRHYFEAEEEFRLVVSGSIAVSLDFTRVPHEGEFLEHLDNVLDEIQIEVSEIEDISVLHPEDGYAD